MRSAVGELIAAARAAMRPRWSQQFLAEELTLRGYPATRSQIARLENSLPCEHSAELLAAAAHVLGIPQRSVQRAIMDDYGSVYQRIAEALAEADA